MADDNAQPYQSPARSDAPLGMIDTAHIKAKPHVTHWLLPILGYAYVPVFLTLVIGLTAQKQYSDAWFLGYAVEIYSFGAMLWLLPVYGLVMLGLTAKRIKDGTNSWGLMLFQLLSMAQPILILLFVLKIYLPGP